MFPNTVMKSFLFTWATLRVFERARDSTSHAHGHHPGRPSEGTWVWALRGSGRGPTRRQPRFALPARRRLRLPQPSGLLPPGAPPASPAPRRVRGHQARLLCTPSQHGTQVLGVEAALSPGPRPGLSGRESREDSDGAGDGLALTGVPLILVPR